MEYKLEELNNALSDKETSNSEDLINQLNQLLLEKNNLQKKNAQIQSTMNDIQTENKLFKAMIQEMKLQSGNPLSQ